VHELEVGMAEEDMCAHAHAFTSLEYDVAYDLPKYRQWLEGECLDHGEHMASVYAEHRVWMQMIAWRRRRRSGKSGLRWCFKMPWHVRSLPALLDTYPDAIIVHTHRPLMEVAGSWCSLVEKQRENFVENAAQVDQPKFAREQLEVLASMLLAGAEWRANHPEVASRWLDVQFSDLLLKPGEVIASVAKVAEVALNSGMRENIEESVRASVAKHKAASRHSYSQNDYGLDGASMPPNIARVLRLYERGLAERAVEPENTDITEVVMSLVPNFGILDGFNCAGRSARASGADEPPSPKLRAGGGENLVVQETPLSSQFLGAHATPGGRISRGDTMFPGESPSESPSESPPRSESPK